MPKSVSETDQTADSTHIAQEIYRKNVELAHTNQTLSLLRTIDNLVLESQTSLDNLTRGVAEAVTANSNFPFSAIFLRGRDELKAPMSLYGFGTQTVPQDIDLSAFEKVTALAVPGWADAPSQCVVITPQSEKSVLDATFKGTRNLTEIQRRYKVRWHEPEVAQVSP